MEDKRKIKTLQLQEGGAKYKTFFTRNYENRKPYSPPNEKHVLTYIPGTIAEIKVKVGQKVEEGNLLFVHEAMKMLNQVESPITGEIKTIHVKEGDTVPKHHLVIEFK